MDSKPQIIGQGSAPTEPGRDPEPLAKWQDAELPAEVGGRDGPEPTRFGDWEKNGRCIDF
jgi:hypothetical protein